MRRLSLRVWGEVRKLKKKHWKLKVDKAVSFRDRGIHIITEGGVKTFSGNHSEVLLTPSQ